MATSSEAWAALQAAWGQCQALWARLQETSAAASRAQLPACRALLDQSQARLAALQAGWVGMSPEKCSEAAAELLPADDGRRGTLRVPRPCRPC